MLDKKIKDAERIAKEIARAGHSREKLEQMHPEGVWSRAELEELFEVTFEGLWPMIVVRRRSDGARGLVMNQEAPCLYFGFFASPAR